MKRLSLSLLCALPLLVSAQSLTQFVDPYIGTGDHGHVFLGANVPFGMVNAGPTQIEEGWDWCSGYHQSGTKIIGFAQTHLSGTGCSDLGDVAILPATSEMNLTREGLATSYSHENEEVRPGYYSILLGTDKKIEESEASHFIRTEVTATRRTALYRITYPTAATQHLIVDLENGVGDRVYRGRLTQLDDTTFVGYRISHGWANMQHCYFAIRLNRKATIHTTSTAQSELSQASSPIYNLIADKKEEPLMVRIALSPVSEINALGNLQAEAYETTKNGWDFESVRAEADASWNKELGRIKASFQNDRDRRIFYTAMFHFMVAPQTWDDVNGDWRGADNHVYRATSPAVRSLSSEDSSPFSNDSYLTTLSLWDTYRAAAPLSTIILPEMMPSIASTYLRIFREQGKLPVWHLMSQETDCMVGCPAVPILADLLLKGYVRDSTLAWHAMQSSLMMDERGLDDMKKFNYVDRDHHEGSLSMTLEYMLADWSAAQAGHAILAHKTNEEIQRGVEFFEQRAHAYRNLYDTQTGFMRARDSHGQFDAISNFDPHHQLREHTEGTAWQYLWLVPQDVDGLIEMLGGREKAVKRLDSLFLADSHLNKEAQPDISGLIGQYAHGNEPSHHIVYLYALMGQPRKTARLIRQIQRELYSDQPAGLCGNEDVGQMSAWYILSALGFYQVEPCGGRYVMGSPLVKDATIQLPEGKSFNIHTHGASEKSIYIKRVLLNGKPLPACTAFSSCRDVLPKGYSAPFILKHEDIMQGGTLDIYMSK